MSSVFLSAFRDGNTSRPLNPDTRGHDEKELNSQRHGIPLIKSCLICQSAMKNHEAAQEHSMPSCLSALKLLLIGQDAFRKLVFLADAVFSRHKCNAWDRNHRSVPDPSPRKSGLDNMSDAWNSRGQVGPVFSDL